MKKYLVIRYIEPIEIEVEAENEDEADALAWEDISLHDLETDSVSIIDITDWEDDEE